MRKYRKYTFIILLTMVASFLCIYGFTFAKYASNSIWDYYLKSKGFYFSSDHLDFNTVKNVDNLWDGGIVHFNIKNNLNQTVITDYDIDYRAVCTISGEAAAHAECHMNGTMLNTQDGVLSNFQACSNPTADNVDVSLFNKTDCELGGYDWENQIALKDLYFDVVLTDSNYQLLDVNVNVTVTSLSPYSKTLSGDFILHKSNIKEAKVTLDYKNYSDYDRLIISNSYTSDKCVRVTWNADKLLIAADTSEFSSHETDINGYINEIVFNIGAKKDLSYMFYKRNTGITYDVTEFQIQETSGCQ